ncbi:unnamed protein product [Polarella glacialis]|uniref:Uncharacterized protein n=1 Tax=Polarella glacialis TaxID=89957 RepID=A0A813HJ73_POLGL|nr:unnamed protein product [Polarella glacialis]
MFLAWSPWHLSRNTSAELHQHIAAAGKHRSIRSAGAAEVLSFFKPAPNTEKFQRPLRELQAVGEQLLRFAMKLGTVIIVTNAMDPWVETSCRNFLPQLLPLVSQLPVIYARSIYEAQGVDPLRSTARSSSPSSTRVPLPGLYAANGQNRLSSFNTKLAQQRCAEEMSPQKWKEVAFSLEINGFYSRYAHQSWKNVISIGDSIFERDAVRRVVVQRPDQKKKCRTKTLKLFDDPEIEELIAQVKVVQDVLNVMVQYDGDLDIEIDEDDLKLEGGCIVEIFLLSIIMGATGSLFRNTVAVV